VWLVVGATQVLAASKRGAGTLTAILIAFGAVALACLVSAVYYAKWVRIEVDESQLTAKLPWSSHSLCRSDLGGLALGDIRIPGVPVRPVFLIYDDAHECRAIFDRRLWPEDVIVSLSDELGVQRPSSRPTTNQRLEAEFPKSISSWRRHSVPIAFAVVLLPVLVIVASHMEEPEWPRGVPLSA